MYVDLGMTIAEIQAQVGGVKVQLLMERHIPRRKPAKRDQAGEKNHMWRGDGASYMTLHARLYGHLGRASEHACVDCGMQAMDWSYDGDCPQERVDPESGCAYSTDPERYSPRCRSCHWKRDGRAHRPNGQWAGRGEVELSV